MGCFLSLPSLPSTQSQGPMKARTFFLLDTTAHHPLREACFLSFVALPFPSTTTPPTDIRLQEARRSPLAGLFLPGCASSTMARQQKVTKVQQGSGA